MRELKTWRDVIKAILDGEDVQYMFGDQYMDREKVPCIPINMLDDKTILEHRIKPKQSKLEDTVKVLNEDDLLTIAYMSGYHDGKRSMTLRDWQPIESAPKDNARPLYLARLDSDGEIVQLDFDGVWCRERERESWEMPGGYYFWGSANGIEEPTHWAYQDAPPPMTPQPPTGEMK